MMYIPNIIRTLKLSFSLFFIWLFLLGGNVEATDLNDIEHLRTSDKFSYYQLGHHIPTKTGHANYTGSRTVIHRHLGLPIEVDPKVGKHMFCNTQISNVKPYTCYVGDGKAKYWRSNHKNNNRFPWVSTFCEKRSSGQHTKACGRTSPSSHQGTDCRPPTPEGGKHWILAVEDARVIRVYSQSHGRTIKMVGLSSKITWVYRHGVNTKVSRGDIVKKGQRLMQVKKLCPTHLHLESIRDGWHLDNMPSLILAYQRAMGVKETPVVNNELKYDPRFEIAAGKENVCNGAEKLADIGTDKQYKFVSFWCHNNSIMGLERQGDNWRFVYFKPRSSLSEAVKRNAVLFRGKVQEGLLTGEALHFSSRCRDRYFKVNGPKPDLDGPVKTIHFTGRRPVFSRKNCQEKQETRQTLVFHYMRSVSDMDGDATSADAVEEVAESKPEVSSETTISNVPGVVSIWSLNGMQLGLSGFKNQRTFTFLRVNGSWLGRVQKGDKLFEGQISEDRTQYDGKGFAYYKNCKPMTFDISGPVKNKYKEVSLTGDFPVLDSNCAKTGSKTVTWTIAFSRKLKQESVGTVEGEIRANIKPLCNRKRCIDRKPLIELMNEFWQSEAKFRKRRNKNLLALQVDAINAVVNVWETNNELKNDDGYEVNRRRLAYLLGTIYHESAKNFYPVRECSCKTDARSFRCVQRLHDAGIARGYRNRDESTGQAYYGRGQVQLTFKSNYKKIDRKFNTIDRFVKAPDQTLDIYNSAAIVSRGLYKGWYRSANGQPIGLEHIYFNREHDWLRARDTIIGNRRAASDVKRYAKKILTGLNYISQSEFKEKYAHKPSISESPQGIDNLIYEENATEIGKIDEQKENEDADNSVAVLSKPTPKPVIIKLLQQVIFALDDDFKDLSGKIKDLSFKDPERDDLTNLNQNAEKLARQVKIAKVLIENLPSDKLSGIKHSKSNELQRVFSGKDIEPVNFVEIWPEGHVESRWCSVNRKRARDLFLDDLDPVVLKYGRFGE